MAKKHSKIRIGNIYTFDGKSYMVLKVLKRVVKLREIYFTECKKGVVKITP